REIAAGQLVELDRNRGARLAVLDVRQAVLRLRIELLAGAVVDVRRLRARLRRALQADLDLGLIALGSQLGAAAFARLALRVDRDRGALLLREGNASREEPGDECGQQFHGKPPRLGTSLLASFGPKPGRARRPCAARAPPARCTSPRSRP